MRVIFYYLAKGFIILVSLLPLPLLYVIAEITRFFLQHVFGYRKQVIMDNMKIAFPDYSPEELQKMVTGFYKNLCEVIVEFIKIPTITSQFLIKRVRFTNPELLEDYAKRNKSLIAISSHMANWEWGGAALPMMAQQFYNLGVYKPLSNKYFDAWFKKLRGKFGLELVPMKATLRELIRHKNELTITTLISDQSPTLGDTDYWADLYGRNVPVFAGAEKIARMMDYTVIYFALRRVKRGYYCVEIIPITEHPKSLAPGAITERYLELLKQEIELAPTDWLWSHRRWKHQGKNPVSS